MTHPVKVVAILAARPGKAGRLGSLLAGMAAPSRAEPGNLRWDLWRGRSGAKPYVIDELYADEAAAAAHHETPHYRNYAALIDGLAERTPLPLDPVDVAEPNPSTSPPTDQISETRS